MQTAVAMPAENSRIQELIEKSCELSVPARIKLARQILETVDGTRSVEPPAKQTKGRPVEELIGLAVGEGPPPTDEEVAKWIDEHRMEKYGR